MAAPGFAALGGDTAALGVELAAGDFTIAAGWSRTWSRTVDVRATALTQLNPFGPGAPIALATLAARTDQLGLSLELALD